MIKDEVNMYPYNKPSRQYQAADAPKTDEIFLDLLIEAMTDEATDMQYYEKLSWMVSDAEDREVVRHVQADEKKHLKALTDIYQMLTGEVPTVTAREFEIGNDLHAEFDKRVLAELNGMEFYRNLYLSHKSTELRDIFFEILTDELEHAVKMQYLRGRN